MLTCHDWLRRRRPTTVAGRALVVAIAIAVAAGVHVATGGRWSWMLGAAAATVSLLAVVPRLGWLVKPVGAYLAVWVGFNLLRAWADDTAWAHRVTDLVPRAQARVLGDRLLSATLQRRFYDASSIDWFDYGWTAVYLSFFVVPHLVAILLLWRDRRLFWHYLLATGVLFSLALVGFYLLPTAPPWLVAEVLPGTRYGAIQRVAEDVLRALDPPVRLFTGEHGSGVRGSEVRMEPNRIAAMPSIHFAVTALLVFPARAGGRPLAAGAALYAGLMGVALVYLGEHYLLDLLVGGLLAATAWHVTARCIAAARGASPAPDDNGR
jgi:membrane-associated phospholipid phosphatase